MSRNILVLVLGFVSLLLSCSPARATNLAFRLERSFAHVSGLRNIYFVSFPLFNGVDDVCDEGHASNACIGQVGGAGDGIITPCDAACSLFTDLSTLPGTAVVSMSRIGADCSFKDVILQKNFLGIHLVSGGVGAGPERLVDYRETGWMLKLTQSVDSENRAVIVGSHDSSYPGLQLPAFEDCSQAILNLPYHSHYKSTNEIICGLEGVDWVDDDGDGFPDTCDGGLFDSPPVGGSGGQVSVSTFNTATNRFESAIIKETFIGLSFVTAPIDLAPGEAYFFQSTFRYRGRLWSPPHF